MPIVSAEKLAGGEAVALGAIEITTIPHISIIDSRAGAITEVLTRFKAEFSSLLGEVFQTYKAAFAYSPTPEDHSLELLFSTHEVKNQPFSAGIRIFLISRAVNSDEARAKKAVSDMLGLVTSAVTLQKYEFRDVPETELLTEIRSVNDAKVSAVVKEEKAENLQNQLLPYCYSFDRIPVSQSDLSRIISILTDNPGCAVSMQLVPTLLSAEEAAELDRITQVLETLKKGVNEQGVGNISFALAVKQAEIYRYYSEHKNSALFAFNVLVYGTPEGVPNIARRVSGQLASGKDQTAVLKVIDLDPAEVDKNNNFYPLPWALGELIPSKERNGAIWGSGMFSPALYRLPYLVTPEEACEFFRLPIGSDRVSAGLHVNESGKTGKTYRDNIINAGDIEVGRLRSSAKGDTIGFSLSDLAKHMLIVGTPGSGKTTFSVSLLDRLWKVHHIPFLVIEPAKNEYRALIKSIPELQVFTPGKNSISPFVFNPFVPPKNVRLEAYKSTLKTAFAAGVSMSTPLDKIFEESVNNCYSDFRWLDTYTSDSKGRVFNISDFIKCFRETFDAIGYAGEARNIGKAGVVRLNSLVSLFDNYHSVPIEDILGKPTVIELAAIENSEQKALIIALLLLSILSYVNANYVGEGGLRNVILLEEAHVLLDPGTGKAGQGEADPSSVAQGLVKRMLAEIRSYGVGIVIADQSPRKVTTDVVALTDMKMVFRLVESADKQIIADSTNMSETQTQRMSKLKPGEAFLFFNKLDEPEEVITPDYRLENKISITLSDESISELSTYWKTRRLLLRPYPQCALCKGCANGCDYERRILAREIARRVFNRRIDPQRCTYESVGKVMGLLPKLIKDELNDEEYSPELLSCVKMHLWRKLRYDSKLDVRDIQIENSLKK